MIPPGGQQNHLQIAERIVYLIAGHLRGTLTDEEADELDNWITESDENLALFEKLTDEENIEAAMDRFHSISQQQPKAWRQLKKKIESAHKPLSFMPWIVAASLLVVIAFTWLLLSKPKPAIEKPLSHVFVHQELPAASSEAVLLLSDGRTLILDSTAKGTLATEGTVSINQTSGGLLQYTGTPTAMRYNSVSTPRGGQYKLVLADGTTVSLNADSYLKFPAGFNGPQRIVELKGEAYFEVAKDAAHPFIVNITAPNGKAAAIEVLGTHFNVKAYTNEASAKTTLVEGLVKITSNGVSKLLHPGEQAISPLDDNQGVLIINKTPDMDEALAWTRHKFIFRNATIFNIGQQLSRWYDVEVEYQGIINQHFNTEADRSLPLQKLLKALEGTNEVQFTVQGRKLIIQPAKVSQ